VRKWEGEFLCDELLHVRAAEVFSLLDLDDLENLFEKVSMTLQIQQRVPYVNRPEAGTMPGCHILVEGLDGICSGQLTVLLVHVVGTGARVVADPDSEVLNLLRALLVDLDIMH
jgi:hypothetical protein